jgi:oligopeptide/dipeptide ABC transporter ATP-binding protein
MTPLLEIQDLKKYFPFKRGYFSSREATVHAVDGVTLQIGEGETLGLAGESGCGKSTLGRLVLGLVEPTAGKVLFQGKDVFGLSRDQRRALRSKMQIIFQDPYSSLNPRMKVGDIVGEGLLIHERLDRRRRREMVALLLERVGIPASMIDRYPHEFSGGQRQRIGIARALICNPRFIVADEPISALDVSIQAQVINLLLELRKEYRLACLFIAHDLRVVGYISDRVAIMYLGRIMEVAPSPEIMNNPLHPYTQVLLTALPVPSVRDRKKRASVVGDVPSPVDLPPGCRFWGRCPYKLPPCHGENPELREVLPNHFVACHLHHH